MAGRRGVAALRRRRTHLNPSSYPNTSFLVNTPLVARSACLLYGFRRLVFGEADGQ
jgi:hypothetical protein